MTNRPRLKTRYPGIYKRETNKGITYIVGFTDAHGTQRTKTLPVGTTLEEARLEKGKLEARKAAGETLVRTRMTVSELLDMYLESRKSTLKPHTYETYEWGASKLKDAFGATRVERLSPSQVASFISDLKQEGKKTWTIKKILTPLQGAYRVAMREGWVSTSPVDKLLPYEMPKADQKVMCCMTNDDISSLFSATSSTRWTALFSTLIFSGLRISEALALRWEDITEDKIIVRQSKTKAGEREVLLIPALRALLSSLRLSQGPGVEHVFATPYEDSRGRTGAPSRREALRALRVAEDAAGIPRYTLHELRHTFASILIAQGELPTLVAKQMGHADPAITMKTYAHLWEEQESVEKARERLQAAMGGLV